MEHLMATRATFDETKGYDYTKVASDWSVVTGTSFKMYVNDEIRLWQLESVLGNPSQVNRPGSGEKIDYQWVVLTPHGAATVYNYKNGEAYLGKGKGTPADQLTEWHIGAKNRLAAWFVKDMIETSCGIV